MTFDPAKEFALKPVPRAMERLNMKGRGHKAKPVDPAGQGWRKGITGDEVTKPKRQKGVGPRKFHFGKGT